MQIQFATFGADLHNEEIVCVCREIVLLHLLKLLEHTFTKCLDSVPLSNSHLITSREKDKALKELVTLFGSQHLEGGGAH